MLIHTSHRQNVIGAVWMIGAMAIFSVEDAFVKAVADLLPVGQILTIFGMGGAAIFARTAHRARSEREGWRLSAGD